MAVIKTFMSLIFLLILFLILFVYIKERGKVEIRDIKHQIWFSIQERHCRAFLNRIDNRKIPLLNSHLKSLKIWIKCSFTKPR